MNTSDFEDKCTRFIKNCITLVHVRPPFALKWEIDHVCYKCENRDSYLKMFDLLTPSYAGHFNTSVISGREISVLEFSTPIFAFGKEVRVLELSNQKPDGSQKEGFDHIEILPIIETTHIDEAGKEHTHVLKGIGGRIVVAPPDLLMNKDGARYRVKIATMPLIERIERERRLAKR